MTVHKVLKYLALVIGVIGLILLGRIIIAGDDAIAASAAEQQSLLEPIMWVGYLVLALCILIVGIFVIKGLFSGHVKNTLISVGAFLVVIAIAYVMTDGKEVQLKDGGTLSANADHWVGAGLWVFYILAAIAAGAMVLSGIKKLIK